LDVVQYLVQDGKTTVDLQVEDGEYGSALSAAAATYGNLEVIK
jgi:hypothetical protein